MLKPDRLAEALIYAENAPATDLYARMNRCRDTSRCGVAACPSCRRRYIGVQRRAAQSRFSAHGNADLAFLTLVIDATPDVLEIEGIFRRFKKSLKNLVEVQRRYRRRWKALQILLWLEVDAVAADDIDKLPPDKREQCKGFDLRGASPSRPVWIITVHGIIAHPGLDIQEVRRELESRWSVSRQVDLRPFYTHQTPKENIARIVGYSLKHLLRIRFGWADGHNPEQTWPAAWAAEYYADLFSWSHGFKSQRMSMSAYDPNHPNSKANREDRKALWNRYRTNDSDASESYDASSSDYLEPMPIVY